MEVEILDGKCLIFSLKDYKKLRQDLRVVPTLIGSNHSTPALPAILGPEEACLVEKHLPLQSIDHKTDTLFHENLRKNLTDVHHTTLHKDTALEIDRHRTEILSAKRQHGDTRTDAIILDEELVRRLELAKRTDLRYILTKQPVVDSISRPADLVDRGSQLKRAVYEDLWKRGLYVTDGVKFGAHFAAYRGDPVAFHSACLVRCIGDINAPIHVTELSAFVRLGCSVRKVPVFATVEEIEGKLKVNYMSFKWIDSNCFD